MIDAIDQTIGECAALQAVPESEGQLLARLRAGDELASAALVRTHGGRMLQVARRFMRCEQDADDVVQDAFLSAFASIDSFAAGSRLSTWLHRITVNAALMKIRSRSRRPETALEGLPDFDATGHHTRPVPPWAADAADRAATGETRQLVREAIDRLPESYRQVLLLRDIEEYDTAEVAAMLGCSTANVKTRLHRARQALRTLLEPVFARRWEN
jgi:RNA polymerase sigma-70 factor (ECF subfamily)